MGQEASKLTLDRIKRRDDFLRAQRGRRQFAPGLTLEACRSPEPAGGENACRVGFTASRKVGGAVERNRAKRRLRALAAAILPLLGRPGHDYVLVAKSATISRPFSALMEDLSRAVIAAHAALDKEENGASSPRQGKADSGKNEQHG